MKPIGRAIFSNQQHIAQSLARIPGAIAGQDKAVDALILDRPVCDVLGDHECHFIALQKDQSMQDVLAAMIQHTSGMVAIYQKDAFVGIICATEMRRAALEKGLDNPSISYVNPFKRLICIDCADPIAAALRQFERHRISRLILTKDGKPCGELTASTLLRWIGRELMAIASERGSPVPAVSR